MPYSYEWIEDKSVSSGYHWRVSDPQDNRIATCYQEQNAKLLVDRLNAKTPSDIQSLVDWRIGYHVEAGAKLIAGALHRIANAMEEENVLRREHLAVALESRDVANRAAERLLNFWRDPIV